MKSLLHLLVVLGIAWGLYQYAQGQKQPSTVGTRYVDEEAVFAADEGDQGHSGTDSCHRYINADRIRDCLDNRLEQARKKHSP